MKKNRTETDQPAVDTAMDELSRVLCIQAAEAESEQAAEIVRQVETQAKQAAEPDPPEQTCEFCDFGDGRSATASPCCDCSSNRVSQFKPRPEKLDRTGQWLMRTIAPRQTFGPIVRSELGYHRNAVSECVFESMIQSGDYIRIPPPPAGVDVTGWDCRKPVRGERYHLINGDGTSRGYTSGDLGDCWDDPIFGMNRWIEPPAAKRTWPVGPFGTFDADDSIGVEGDAIGQTICYGCTQAGADAIAKALDVMPRVTEVLEAVGQCEPWLEEKIDEILADLDGWDMKGKE